MKDLAEITKELEEHIKVVRKARQIIGMNGFSQEGGIRHAEKN